MRDRRWGWRLVVWLVAYESLVMAMQHARTGWGLTIPLIGATMATTIVNTILTDGWQSVGALLRRH